MIPDSMPALGRGDHRPDSGAACVMEYVSLIKGFAWTDNPACTEPAIAEMARMLNDSIVDDDERSQVLVPLIGKIMACAPSDDNSIHRVLDMVTPEGSWVMDNRGIPVAERAEKFEQVMDLYLEAIGVTPEPVTPVALAEAEAKVLAVL